MGTPHDFRLEMVDSSMCPLPSPPRYLKHQIYTEPSVFKVIDKHAVDEARTNYRNFRDLIWNLAYRKNFNQLERVRAIFRWMTTKNMFTVMFDSELPGSPEHVIAGFKDGKTTYARIFECLACFAGVHCVTLSGWAKGVDYRPGSPICSTPINHSWNACFIDGNWQLVDSHWATRYLQSERNTPENLVYEYDDFYFLPEPGHLIYSHCPEDPAWQLIKPAAPRSTFEEYPLVKSFFFTMGMEFLRQNYGVVYTKKGLVTLTLGYKIPNTAFTFKIGYGDGMVETVHGIDLKRYIIQETTMNRVTFYFRAPREGNYYLTVFAQQVGERLKLENIFKAACEYKIVCDQAAGDIRPYPQGSDANWGPGAPVQQYGLTPSHKTAILTATNGKAEVNFAKSRDVRLYARLNRDGMDEDMLERCVSVREQDNIVYVTVHLPAQGEYGLEIYANEPDIEGDTFTHMCQYLCSHIDRDFGTAYGQVFDRNDLAFKSHANPMMYASPQAQQYAAEMAPAGPGGERMAPVGGDKAPPGGKQVYQTSSQDWDGNTFTQRSYREEQEAHEDGLRSYRQQSTQMTTRMETVSMSGPGGKKLPPPTAPKPKRGQPGAGDQDDLPPPPPELMQQQQRGSPGGPQYGQRPGEQKTTYIPVQQQPGQQEQPGQRAPYGQQPQQYDQYGRPIPGPEGMVYGQQPQYDQYGRPIPSQDTAEKRTAVPVLHTSYPFGRPEDTQALSSVDAQRPVEPEREYTPHSQKTYTSSITVLPPAHFEPKPIAAKQDAPRPAPPSVPPKPFKDTSIFQNVDTHAVEVSKEDHRNFRDLVWHLIYAREITNELEKARAIFLWLCSKDLSQLSFSDVEKGSPEEILTSLKKGTTTYAVVYETLCSYAGLHCKTISGYAKGAEYKPGMKFTGEQGQHSWNSVLVEGAWRLVDCHWAARRLVGKKVTAENVRYELDEYYFMPDPHQLIFTHFPDDRNWQLVERPISLGDFENLVPVKSAFFKYGLQILTHREAVITTNREVTIRVGCPPARSHQLAFTFTLAYSDGKEEFGTVKLNRFGMQEMVDNVSFFTIRPPEKASYRLIIYAKDLAQQTKEGVYGGVCEYELVCQSSPPHPQPFPPCVHTSWGPGDSATKYGLEPRQKGAIFSTVRGMAEVRFSLPRDLRFTAKLKSNNQDEKALQGYIMHRVVENVAIFTITAPSKGEFGLEIYANDPEVDGNSLYHAYQYLLICTDMPGPAEPLPALPPGYLGPQPSFRKLGLSAASHIDPFIQLDSGDLQVTFVMEEPLRMTSQLIYVSEGKNEDFTDYILQQGRDNSVIFVIKLPKMGLYKFQIYGLPYSDTSESLPGVYNYLINCHQTQATLVTFPKQYGQWKEGCYLHEPLDGQLSPNRLSKGSASSYNAVFWRVEVSKANAVAVVVGEDWTQLEKHGASWEGEVNMEKHWGHENKAAVCANYGTVKASYSTLLEYAL